MLDDILNAIIAALQADTLLPETFGTYNKVQGMIPGLDPTVSLWVPEQKFKDYDNDYDEVDAEIHIGIALQDIDAESGEQRIRALAEEIRLLLTADQRTLGGLIDDSFLSDWKFDTYQANETEQLHLGEAMWNAKYYAPRSRAPASGDSMDEMDFDESIIPSTS